MSSKWFSNKAFKLSLHRLRHPRDRRRRHRLADEYREAFRRFDADGDGRISGAELRSFLGWAGEEDVSPRAAEAAMRDFDSDGDGLMDYDDFARLMEADRRAGGGGEGGGGEALRGAFEVFEVEKGSGRITAGGLRRVLSRLGDDKSYEECAAMIRAYDLDGDGELDYNEFLQMMS